MKNINYNYICTTIANLSGIPTRVYENGKLIIYSSVIDLPVDPIIPYINNILSIQSHIGYFITPQFHYYAIVNSKNIKMVIGPTFQTQSSDSSLRELSFLCGLVGKNADKFISGFKRILKMPLDSILQIMCTLNYIANDETLSLVDLRIYDSEQEKLKYSLEKEFSAANLTQNSDNNASYNVIHNTLSIEKTITNFVRNGETKALKEWMSNVPATRGGVLAFNQLRQLKNTFIVTATLVSRAAIEGGVDVDDALSLSDAYIQKCEIMNDLTQITSLQYRMIFDYTEMVEKIKSNNASSKLIFSTINYIHHHIDDNLTVEGIAKAMFISRSYLSHKFSEEMKMTISEYILKEKIEKAKYLLKYTNQSLVTISTYLGFSSQSHFTRTFKKYTGHQPSIYRKNICNN